MSSAILSADDLNDFISPGVACIKPVETLPKTDDSNPYEVTTEDKIQAQNPAPASISLTDCLACSGCVTSAEAVLVSLQSHTEVLNTLDTFAAVDLNALPGQALDQALVLDEPCDSKVFVASVSPQVRASLAATYGISEQRAGNIIEQFLSGSQGLRIGGHKQSYFHYVLDTNRMRDACLVLGAEEVAASIADKSLPKPVISSACPGWICYAEKQQPHVLPHLSATKSPQALTGTLVKSVLSRTLGVSPSQIWHLAIMPCFDKKLEASREELTDKHWLSDQDMSTTQPIRDVDCVITSRELLTLASSRDISLAALPQRPLSSQERASFPDVQLAHFFLNPRVHTSGRSNTNTSDLSQALQGTGTSGGYLGHILATQQSLHPDSHIAITRGRNADVIEYTLLSSSNAPILKCARYYGFKNITNLVRKLKPARASKLPGATRRPGANAKPEGMGDYVYVEVMACPGGCTNGGGQLKIEDVRDVLPQTRGETVQKVSLQTQREWLARVDEAYFSGESEDEDWNVHTSSAPSENAADKGAQGDCVNGINVTEVKQILSHWSQLVQVPLDKLAYTTFRKVESDVGKKKTMGDSERIAAIAGMSGGGW